MNSIPLNVARYEESFGGLAIEFRGTRIDAARRDIAADYSKTVERLIQSGRWFEMPPPEDQLCDDWMPREFFDFWSRSRSGPRQ